MVKSKSQQFSPISFLFYYYFFFRTPGSCGPWLLVKHFSAGLKEIQVKISLLFQSVETQRSVTVNFPL